VLIVAFKADIITFDDRELRQYEEDLLTLKERSYPFASRFSIWQYAETAQIFARQIVEEKMILKAPAKFTQKSIQFWPSSAGGMSLNPRNQFSIMGSTLKYMETQEFVGIKRKRGKVGVTIPTSESARQKETRPRTKVVHKDNWLSKIKLRKKRVSRKSKQRTKQHSIILIEEAKKAKKNFVYLETHRTKGIFRIKGTKKKRKIRMLYNLENKQVRIPPLKWMQPAIKEVRKEMPIIYKDALIKQLKRLKTYKF
jgi:hypothetical protein